MQKYDAKLCAVLQKIPKCCFWVLNCAIGVLKKCAGCPAFRFKNDTSTSNSPAACWKLVFLSRL